jgi:hypothetical protein
MATKTNKKARFYRNETGMLRMCMHMCICMHIPLCIPSHVCGSVNNTSGIFRFCYASFRC